MITKAGEKGAGQPKSRKSLTCGLDGRKQDCWKCKCSSPISVGPGYRDRQASSGPGRAAQDNASSEDGG